jgi:DNA-directed RNA polymerase subunit RPC12/RpoP
MRSCFNCGKKIDRLCYYLGNVYCQECKDKIVRDE